MHRESCGKGLDSNESFRAMMNIYTLKKKDYVGWLSIVASERSSSWKIFRKLYRLVYGYGSR